MPHCHASERIRQAVDNNWSFTYAVVFKSVTCLKFGTRGNDETSALKHTLFSVSGSEENSFLFLVFRIPHRYHAVLHPYIRNALTLISSQNHVKCRDSVSKTGLGVHYNILFCIKDQTGKHRNVFRPLWHLNNPHKPVGKYPWRLDHITPPNTPRNIFPEGASTQTAGPKIHTLNGFGTLKPYC